MQLQRREFERIPIDRNIRFFCEQAPYAATMINCARNGIGLTTFSNWLPCSFKVDLIIPLHRDIISLHGRISWIKKASEYNHSIGIQLVRPPSQYLDYIDALARLRERQNILRLR